jgi:hypothetical protein
MFGLDAWGYVLVSIIGAIGTLVAAYFGFLSSNSQFKIQRRSKSGQIETSEARELWDARREWENSRDRFEELLMRALEFFANQNQKFPPPPPS